MKIIQSIPVPIRKLVPEKTREKINNYLNYVGILRRKFIFSLNRKKCIENKFENALRSEYVKYTNIMQERTILKFPTGPNLLVLPRMVFSTTNKCSLRCKDCNNLIPYFECQRDIPAEKMIAYIDKFFSIVDYCICVEVIGGEPFLYKDLGIVLRHLINKPQVYSIEVTTNGTLIPSDELLQLLKNEKIYVSLSDYEAVSKTKKNLFIDCMEKHLINHKIINMHSSWVDSGNTEKRNRSKNALKWQYYACRNDMFCKTFWDGKLFACGRAPAIYELCDLKDSSSFFDLDQVSPTEAKDKLKQFYLSEYAECCDYCDNATWPVKFIKGGIQIY